MISVSLGKNLGEHRRDDVERCLEKKRDLTSSYTAVNVKKLIAHADGPDPLAQLNLDASDFAWITAEIVALANQCSQGRIVSTLEGGYDLRALATFTRSLAHLEAIWR